MRTPDDTWDITSSVGVTALSVAAARATESARPDRIIDDPYAERFVQTAAPPALRPEDRSAATGHDMHNAIAVQTKLFDEFFNSAARDGIEQAVILASGLDARPYRTRMPERTFEIDQPAVLEFKQRVLREAQASPRTNHDLIGIDLRHDWPSALTRAGFDPQRRTAWLAEGLMPYLPAHTQRDLFARIDTLSCPASTFAVQQFRESPRALAEHPVSHQSAQQWGFSLRDLIYEDEPVDVHDWFHRHGWNTQIISVADKAHAYERPLAREDSILDTLVCYVTGTKN